MLALSPLGTRLYVFGGYTFSDDTMSFEHSRTSEMYEEETGQWTMLENMPDCYEHLFNAATELNGIIYIIGNLALSSGKRCLACFNVDSEKMSEGEECDASVQKIVAVRIPIHPDLE